MSAAGLTYDAAARQAAASHNVPYEIFSSLIAKLSGWKQSAISSTGAVGLTGITPAQGAMAGNSNVYDPVANLNAGASRLSTLYKQTGNWSTALSNYPFEPGMMQPDTAFATSVMTAAKAAGYGGAPSTTPSSGFHIPTWKELGSLANLSGATELGGPNAGATVGATTPDPTTFLTWFKNLSLSNMLIYGGTLLAMVGLGYFAVKSLFKD